MVKLRDAVTQLRMEPPPARAPSDQQSRLTQEATVETVHFEASQHTVALSAVALKKREEDSAREMIIICLDKLSLAELYQIQQETQFELRHKEEQVHSRLSWLPRTRSAT